MESVMKKIFYVLLFAFMMVFAFTGCSSSGSLAEIKAEYLKMLQESPDLQSVADIGEFLDLNLSKFEEEHADQMVIAYEDYIFALDSEMLDYREFLNRYQACISNMLIGLYEIKIEEQENPAVNEGILQKSWKQLYERALILEVFIKEAKNYQIVKEEAAIIYSYYIRLMFMGTNKSPIFDQSNGNFDQYAKNAYVEFSEIYPDTTVSEMINEYLSYLESINFDLDYENITEMTNFSETCSYLVSEARKRVLQ
jgi:hypothetical protein